MKTKRITRWIRIVGDNLEIGNFGNDGVIPKSIFIENREVPGSFILRDEIQGNLVLENVEVKNNIKVVSNVQGMIQMNECWSNGFVFLYKNNLQGEFVARNCNMKGIFFLKGDEPFCSIDLSNSEFQYLTFGSSFYELLLRGTTVEKFSIGKHFYDAKPVIDAQNANLKEIVHKTS